MWRPFASKFATHSFDNYSHNLDRAETAPLTTIKSKKQDVILDMLFPFRQKKEKSAERAQKLGELQEKVKKQRLLIKKKDLLYKQRKESIIKNQIESLSLEKEQRKNAMIKIRAFATSTPKVRKRSISPVSKSLSPIAKNDDMSNLFFLTDINNTHNNVHFSTPNRVKRKQSLPPIKNKQFISLKNYQEKLLKRLESKTPTYLKKLKSEFDKIREEHDLTFAEYQEKKRLRRHSAFPVIRFKSPL
ncbi:unnamed protein product [Blepharisma stoltei]|uniref:Uncharacterized protein n=1 Tax=Blepharisma stoltei TaxID=1481888 RepID=A0AAU9IWP5_9CILI|nr:unnamed protein product [Blepharisma stoltei]